MVSGKDKPTVAKILSVLYDFSIPKSL